LTISKPVRGLRRPSKSNRPCCITQASVWRHFSIGWSIYWTNCCELLLLLTGFNSQSKMQSLRTNEYNEIVHVVIHIYNKLAYCQIYFIVRLSVFRVPRLSGLCRSIPLCRIRPTAIVDSSDDLIKSHFVMGFLLFVFVADCTRTSTVLCSLYNKSMPLLVHATLLNGI
jgi:hypothetical protein